MRPMLATPGHSVPPGEEWVHEVKWDGVRALTEVRDGVQEFNFRKAVGTKGAGIGSAEAEVEDREAGPRLAALLATIQADEAGTSGAQSRLSAALSRRTVQDRSAAMSRFAHAALAQTRHEARPHRSAATSDMLAPVA